MNFCVKITNEHLSKAVQQTLFDAGYKWYGLEKNQLHYPDKSEYYLHIGRVLTWSEIKSYQVITIAELLAYLHNHLKIDECIFEIDRNNKSFRCVFSRDIKAFSMSFDELKQLYNKVQA